MGYLKAKGLAKSIEKTEAEAKSALEKNGATWVAALKRDLFAAANSKETLRSIALLAQSLYYAKTTSLSEYGIETDNAGVYIGNVLGGANWDAEKNCLKDPKSGGTPNLLAQTFALEIANYSLKIKQGKFPTVIPVATVAPEAPKEEAPAAPAEAKTE